MSRSASYDELLTVCIQDFYTAEIIPRDTPAKIVARQRPQARAKGTSGASGGDTAERLTTIRNDAVATDRRFVRLLSHST